VSVVMDARRGIDPFTKGQSFTRIATTLVFKDDRRKSIGGGNKVLNASDERESVCCSQRMIRSFSFEHVIRISSFVL
jgi:hypothetical protein